MNIIGTNEPSARDNRSGPKSGPSGASRTRTLRSLWMLPFAAMPAILLGSGRPDPVPAAPAPVIWAGEAEEVMGAALPLHLNARVEKWIDRFTTSQRPAFQRLLARKGLYEDMILEKLRERDMPEELLYLAMMESGLSARAVSHASAVGLWQFMGPTAREVGLRIDENIDERRDPVRATDAALDYIQWLHDRYGSWYLAAAAYNAGPGRIDRELNRHAAGREWDDSLYWELLEHLPRETREYVPRLVAATVVGRNAAELGFDTASAAPYSFDRVFVPGGTSLSSIARTLGVRSSVLRDLNPHVLRGATPAGEVFPIRVPLGTSPAVVASLGRVGRLRAADD